MGDETIESQNAAFWLPSHFLTDDDFLPLVSDHNLSLKFDPFAPHTDNSKDKENDDELLSELTRHLAHSSLNHSTHQSWNLSTSPQSTLSGLTSNGSSNGDSPPLTPPGSKYDVAWDLLYQAATQVARIKMAAQLQHTGGLTLNHHHHHLNSSYNTHQLKGHGSGNSMWAHHQNTQRPTSGGFNALPRSAWRRRRHNLNHRDLGIGPVFVGSGQPVKKQSTGTGVFIPRRYGTHTKPRQNPPVTLPGGGVVGAMNVKHQHINKALFINPSRFTTANYGANILMAPRNAVMNHKSSSIRQEMPVTMVGQDVRLPIDWTY